MSNAQSDAHRKEGNRFLADGDLRGAEACYRRSIAADPGSAEACVALGFVLLKQERLDDAKPFLEMAVSLDSGNADGHYLLGTIAQKRSRPAEAIAEFSKALAINPRFAEAQHDMGVALRAQGKLDEALRCFDRALSIQPGFAPSRFSKSLALLLLGDYPRGLELFESRLEACEDELVLSWLAFLSKHPEKPRWQGEALRGRSLLVWTEQGAGDCMMMARYLPRLVEKGAGRILVLSDPSLIRLFKALPLACEVLSRVDTLPLGAFDLHCPMMSLPLVFGTRLETIPRAVPYLRVPPELRESWSRRLAESKGLKVGLAWAGNRKYGRDFLRSVAFHQLRPLFGIPGVTYVSLQKGAAAEERDEASRFLADWMDACVDFMDTAALIANLDLVLSVDTSVAHLAGALGRPVWLLNRFESEWRWLREGEKSPWYPTMRIFRQAAPNDWQGVIGQLARELAQLASSGKARV